jgi:hypothetical protein
VNIRAYLKLVRISALPSALADVFGGMALVAAILPNADIARWPWLLLATGGIYLGGMALNDVMHAQKDILLGKKRPTLKIQPPLAASPSSIPLFTTSALSGRSRATPTATPPWLSNFAA